MLVGGESIAASLQKDAKKTIHMLTPIFFVVTIFFIEGMLQTEAFANQFILCSLVHNFVLNHAILRLMVTNMTKRPFALFSYEYIFGILPLLAHVLAPTPEMAAFLNPIVSIGCAIFLHISGYTHLGLICNQFYAQNPDRHFWYILDKKEENKKQK